MALDVHLVVSSVKCLSHRSILQFATFLVTQRLIWDIYTTSFNLNFVLDYDASLAKQRKLTENSPSRAFFRSPTQYSAPNLPLSEGRAVVLGKFRITLLSVRFPVTKELSRTTLQHFCPPLSPFLLVFQRIKILTFRTRILEKFSCLCKVTKHVLLNTADCA